MAYRAYQPERRTRRRRWLLIALTLVIVVAGIAFLVSRQTEQRGTVEFLAAADEATQLTSEASEILSDTLGELGPMLSRQEVTRRLTEVTTRTADAEALLALDVPPSMGASYGALTASVSAWHRGAIETERVLLGIMDGEIVTGAETELERALDLMRVGDVGYALFREEIAALADDLEPPDFVVVTFVDPEPVDALMFDAQQLALRLAAAYNLAPRIDVGVVGMTDPDPIGDRGGIPVVPFSEEILLNAVVSNLGNEAADTVEVVLDLFSVDTEERLSERALVDGLEAGASTTVSFDDLAIEPGGLYQATVSVTIDGDNDPDNNVWSMTFVWNAES